MKYITLFILVLLSFPGSLFAATTYYVDNLGDDDDPGTSPETAWQTISKVNGASLVAGDTVKFKRGDSWYEELNPQSGDVSDYITYEDYDTGSLPDIRNLAASGDSYVIIRNLAFTGGTTYATFELDNTTSYFKVYSCEFTGSGGGDAVQVDNSSHHNLFYGCTSYSSNHWDITIHRGAHHNVFRNCTILAADDSGIAEAAGDDYDPVPYRNLIEQCTIKGCSVGCPGDMSPSLKQSGTDSILRQSLLISNAGDSDTRVFHLSAVNYTVVDDNVVYNCVIADNNGWGIYMYGGNTGVTIEDNIYKNNAIYANTAGNQLLWASSITWNNYFFNNLFYKSGDSLIISYKGTAYSVSGVEIEAPSYFSGNIQSDPYLDSGYVPVSGSPCIDAGTWLTTTTSSGSGTSVPVADASYFYDGWGIPGETGDTIQFQGQTSTYTITSINYGAGTLEIDSSASWSSGLGVALPYNGSAPDIGAYESEEVGKIQGCIITGGKIP